jgi:myo-inositol-1(or 4)-monophosphatase
MLAPTRAIAAHPPWHSVPADPIVGSMLTTPHADHALRLMPRVQETAREAGTIALKHFREGRTTGARIWSKAGNSPVTEADLAVDAFLKERLADLLPEAAWLSEETADDPVRLRRDLLWIVDPIDGTRAFLSGVPDWSVSIGLLAAGRPILGIVYAPALGQLYEASLGSGARRNGQPLHGPAAGALGGARVTGPKPLVDALEQRSGAVERLPKVPSLALRIARVAEGSIDVGLVSANSHDWDLAGADLILHEAGGRLTDLRGESVRYNQADPIHGELVATSEALHSATVTALRR